VRLRRPWRGALLFLLAATLGGQALIAGFAVADPSGPPPTPVPPNGSPSPFPQSLQTPADPIAVPTVEVPVALLADLDDGQVMFARGPSARRPIASLTKIMTALLVFEHRNLGDVVTVDPRAVFDRDDFGASSTLGLRAGERRTVRELLDALMLQSANDAAVALAIEIAGSEERFVTMMNRRAHTLGMRGTTFRSPNGLDDRGHSTARDLLTLVRAAYRTPGFPAIVADRFRTIPGGPGGRPRQVQNRNAMLWLYPGAIGVKTGFTSGAGYCLIAVAERDGRRLAAIVLGSRDEAFSEAATLLNFGFEGFTDETFVRPGEDLGTVAIRGGAVAANAGSGLEALVHVGALDEVERRIVVSDDAVFPPVPGDRIGTLKVMVPGMTVGSVPVIVDAVPLPPPAGDAPWWARSIRSVGEGIGDVIAGLLG
jgi:D-alanyl-D-alanine carboxypeptidase (penicillin-binding protein 5/6)